MKGTKTVEGLMKKVKASVDSGTMNGDQAYVSVFLCSVLALSTDKGLITPVQSKKLLQVAAVLLKSLT